jgi:hypothetical protein
VDDSFRDTSSVEGLVRFEPQLEMCHRRRDEAREEGLIIIHSQLEMLEVWR